MKKFSLLMLIIAVLFVTIPASASDMGLKKLSGKVGLLFPSTTGVSYGLGFGFGAAADMGELTDNLKLVPIAAYWIMNGNVEGVSELDVSASNFQIGADVQYYLKDVKGLYFGGGLSINFNSISIDYAGIPGVTPGGSTKASGTDIGLGLLGGYEMPIGKTTTGFAQAKYNIISDLNTFEINVGVWFDMK